MKFTDLQNGLHGKHVIYCFLSKVFISFTVGSLLCDFYLFPMRIVTNIKRQSLMFGGQRCASIEICKYFGHIVST